jgi:hypothetical protein
MVRSMICEISVYPWFIQSQWKSYLTIINLWYDKTISTSSVISIIDAFHSCGRSGMVWSFVLVWLCITGFPSFDISVFIMNVLFNNNSSIWDPHRSCLHLPLCSCYRVSDVSGIYPYITSSDLANEFSYLSLRLPIASSMWPQVTALHWINSMSISILSQYHNLRIYVDLPFPSHIRGVLALSSQDICFFTPSMHHRI